MIDAELVQDSPEWLAARCGSVGSSDVADLMRKIKSGGPSATRASLMARKTVERLTERPIETYQSRAMLDGKVREAEARATYEFLLDVRIELVGLVRHPLIEGGHASPDGLIGNLGLVEIKCPEHAAHLETLLTEKIDRDYRLQMQWQMACTGRHWCDYVSYHPDFPASMQLFVQRQARDPELIDEVEEELKDFLADLDVKVRSLVARYAPYDHDEEAD